MKKLIPTLLTAASCLGLTACDGANQMNGQLNLQRSVMIRAVGGSVAPLAPATYPASVVRENNGGKVYVQTNKGNVAFNLPAVVPDANGYLAISAAQLGQEFGLSGYLRQGTVPLNRVVDVYCVYDYRYQRRCEVDSQGRVRCYDERIEIPGKQKQRQEGIQEIRSANLNLVRTGEIIGAFTGQQVLRETIQRRTPAGYCERR